MRDRGGWRDAVGMTADEPSANGHAPNLSGAEVLDRLVAFIRRFVAIGVAQAVLIALWIVHTHALDAADCTPYLSITSAEKRSGKTRLLEVLALLVARAWLTGRVSAAVLVRKTANEEPTLLLDESDAAFKGDKEYAEALRGILNAGFRRGGVTSLCVGQGANITYQDFPVFSPKVIAGIGKLPDTVADRAIPIELQRRRPTEQVERFRLRKAGPEALPLQSAAAAWAEAHLGALAEAEPELPEQLDDRAMDIVEPLLAIADEAGGEWPTRAREAAVALLTGEHREDAESLGVRLLRDVRSVFDEEGADRLRTTAILTALNTRDDAPWGSLRGEALDARGVARFLKPYGVKPEQLRIGDENVRGYRRASFEDAWARYLPEPDPDPAGSGKGATPATSATDTMHNDSNPHTYAGNSEAGSVADSVADALDVADNENHPLRSNPHKQADVAGVADVAGNPGGREETASSTGKGRRLRVDEVLKEINRSGSGPAIQAGCHRRGEITEENAIEWVTKAILVRRGQGTDDWERQAPAVEAALTHPLDCDCEECA